MHSLTFETLPIIILSCHLGLCKWTLLTFLLFPTKEWAEHLWAVSQKPWLRTLAQAIRPSEPPPAASIQLGERPRAVLRMDENKV